MESAMSQALKKRRMKSGGVMSKAEEKRYKESDMKMKSGAAMTKKEMERNKE